MSIRVVWCENDIVETDAGDPRRLATVLLEVIGAPRAEGMTLTEMSDWLAIMEVLRAQTDAPRFQLRLEHHERVSKLLASIRFMRPNEGLYNALMTFMSTKPEV